MTDPARAATGGASAGGSAPRYMSPADMLALPRPPADHRIAYGENPLQFGDLFLPRRTPRDKEEFPVALLLHGGCWEAGIGLDHLSGFCVALAEAGVAAWNVEYRCLGDPDGGWPGTFLDVLAAHAHVARLRDEYPIDPKRVIVIGHSAGGHLALWLAASGMATGLRAVLSIAGVTDLSAGAGVGRCAGMVPRLIAPDPLRAPAPLSSVSPVHMDPPSVPVRLITAGHDAVVPPSQAESYLAAVGDRATRLDLPDSGHFELITPGTRPCATVLAEALRLVESPSSR